MPGRNGSENSGDDYRYGFNGKESDSEVSGEGNSYDFGARMYNPRIGKFFSLDSKSAVFPYLSPYCYAANNPIYYEDENGDGPEPGKKAVSEAHRTFLKKIGYKAYQKARNEGFSVQGALIYVGLTANETGWNKLDNITKALENNNFTGLGGADNLDAYSSPSVEEGVQRGIDKLEQRWPEAYQLLKDKNVDAKKLDKALVSGNYGEGIYNTSAQGDAYGTYMKVEMLPSIVDRFKTVIFESTQELTKTINNLESKNKTLILSRSTSKSPIKKVEISLKIMVNAVKIKVTEDKIKENEKFYNEINQ